VKETEFEQRYRSEWDQFEASLTGASSTAADYNFPAHYRLICSHLSLAKHRRYSPELLGKLNDLATRGYFLIYGANYNKQQRWLRFIVVDFPSAVYHARLYVLIAALLFVLPGIVMGTASYLTDDIIYSIYPSSDVRSFEAMYDPSNDRFGRDRDSEDDWLMFGIYIYNNIGIAFRTYATGLLFGLGSVFFLMYNGLAIGGVAGHIARAGYGITFFPFVAGHSALELTAIVLSGAAGIQLGKSILIPGQRSRLSALKSAARTSVVIVYGAAIMLVFAAAVEAFWSSRSGLPPMLKYAVGGILWVLVLVYLSSGRKRLTYESR